MNPPIEDGPHITRIAQELLKRAVERGAEFITLFPNRTEGFGMMIQIGKEATVCRFQELETTSRALSICYAFIKLVDTRSIPAYLIKQGHVQLRILGKDWRVSITCIPDYANVTSESRPTVLIGLDPYPVQDSKA